MFRVLSGVEVALDTSNFSQRLATLSILLSPLPLQARQCHLKVNAQERAEPACSCANWRDVLSSLVVGSSCKAPFLLWLVP